MTLLPRGVKIHLAFGFIDMRKGIDGLAMLVQGMLRQDPFSGHLFERMTDGHPTGRLDELLSRQARTTRMRWGRVALSGPVRVKLDFWSFELVLRSELRATQTSRYDRMKRCPPQSCRVLQPRLPR